MREQQEIQRAHDILHHVVMGKTRIEANSQTMLAYEVACTTLCWVLEHADNPSFATELAKLEVVLAKHGLVLRKADRPFVGDPPNEDG